MNAEVEQLTSSIPPRMFELVRRDIQRYFLSETDDGKPGLWQAIRILLDTPGLQVVLIYRFGSWVNRRVRFPLIRIPLKLVNYILKKLCGICAGAYIDDQARIGGGLYIAHCMGVLIGPIQMGNDCNVGRNVAIGRRAGGNSSGVPVIGNRVWIGAGSIIFGGVTIGDGATIGPLSVVGRNLPPRVLVMGNPMRLLRKNYDNSAEIYGKGGA